MIGATCRYIECWPAWWERVARPVRPMAVHRSLMRGVLDGLLIGRASSNARLFRQLDAGRAMWKQFWRKWTVDKPAAFGDMLWEALVVQFAAWLDRLTLRQIIAFIPVLILV